MSETKRARRPNPGRDVHKAQRREELLDAAVRTIRRVGPAASMEDIAAEAGITKPILYRYFGDRGGLTAGVAERFAGELMARLRAALASSAPPRDLVAATIDAYLAFVEADPELYRFLIRGAAVADPSSHATLSSFVRQVGQEVAVVLGEQLRAAGRDSGAAEPWAYGIVGMVHQAGDWWVQRRTMPRARLVEYLTSLLWSGVFSTELVTDSMDALAAPPGLTGDDASDANLRVVQ
jgi:AcrR family transcriptional regulator